MQSYKDRIAAYLKNEKAAVGMPISPKAFIILNLVTLGAFTQVWAYHNFQKDQHYKKHPKLIAFVKCLFLPITLITLLNYLEEAAKQLGSTLKIPKNLIAFCYLLSLAVNIYSVLMDNAISSSLRLTVWVCCGFVQLFMLVFVQLEINRINEELRPSVNLNKYKMNLRKYFAAVIFSFLFLASNLLSTIFLNALAQAVGRDEAEQDMHSQRRKHQIN